MSDLTKITLEWLRKHIACDPGVAWFRQRPDLHGAEWPAVCKALEADGQHDWSLWIREELAYWGTAADLKALRNDPSLWVRLVVAAAERAAREETT